MTDQEASNDVPTCCGAPMHGLASVGGNQRVVIYGCEMCERTEALGFSSDPWWVSAKARAFLRLRSEAFRLAGLEPPPAVAIFDSEKRQVVFG
jgi:hypothetical protein